jgi:hypothetical protein
MPKSSDAGSPDEYIAGLDEPRRGQIARLHELIRRVVPELEPHMQSGMIGSALSLQIRVWKRRRLVRGGTGSNKRYISLYVSATEGNEYVAERYKSKLPKADIGKSCIRFKKLDDVDLDVVTEVIQQGAHALRPN